MGCTLFRIHQITDISRMLYVRPKRRVCIRAQSLVALVCKTL